MGVEAIVQPPLTQTLGPWLATCEGKYPRRLEAEKRLLGSLIEQLPHFDLFRQCFTPALTNWLPFYWAGFEATVRYSYRIEDLVGPRPRPHRLPGPRAARNPQGPGHRRGARRPLRRAADRARRADLRPPGPAPAGPGRGRAPARCGLRGARRAADPCRRRRPRANPRGRSTSSGTIGRCMRSSTRATRSSRPLAPTRCSTGRRSATPRRSRTVFDFEGSMIEPIEHFVRGFGGRQTPYFCVSKAGLKARVGARGPLGARRDRTACAPACVGPGGTGASRSRSGAAAACGLGLVGRGRRGARARRRPRARRCRPCTGSPGSTGRGSTPEIELTARLADPVPYASGRAGVHCASRSRGGAWRARPRSGSCCWAPGSPPRCSSTRSPSSATPTGSASARSIPRAGPAATRRPR